MSIANPFSTKVDNVDSVTAAEINASGVAHTKAVDGVGGGTYAPSSPIDIGGSGIRTTGTSRYLLASRSKTYTQGSPKLDSANGTVAFAGATVQTGDVWTQQLLIPDGVTITAVTVYIDPADDALPTTNATVTFRKHNVTTGSTTTISTTVDPNTGASYQALHGFGPTGLTEVVTRATHNYFVFMTPEVGGDLDDYTWHGTTVTYTTTAMDDGY